MEEWVVIVLKAEEIVQQLDCAYFEENAATHRSKRKDWTELNDLEAFQNMFKEDRRYYTLEDCYPSNPQAEVMGSNAIPSTMIKEIHVDSDTWKRNAGMLNRLKSKYPGIKFVCSNEYFKKRKDSKMWR